METRTAIEPILVSKKDSAEAIAVCVRTVEYLIATKQIATRKVGRRTLVLYSSLKAFARRDTPTIEKPPRKTPRMEKPTAVRNTDVQ